jgi:hypothetical protein
MQMNKDKTRKLLSFYENKHSIGAITQILTEWEKYISILMLNIINVIRPENVSF